ncbi:MAG: class I tRNA ligase family protein, partial [Patescibacteria group bacterium]
MQERDEKQLIAFWKDNQIFEKSVAAQKGKAPFVFFDGPPTANGTPHIGHAETRAFKDVMLRYKTMRGYHVPRRAGWDTQGLPVEIEVEKTLGLKTKKDVEAYGIERFNAECKKSVWKYKELWQEFSDRMGFWIDNKNAYVTYENTYLESLWWVIKQVSERGLLYEDHKILPWCTRCETGLSSHELAQGYQE